MGVLSRQMWHRPLGSIVAPLYYNSRLNSNLGEAPYLRRDKGLPHCEIGVGEELNPTRCIKLDDGDHRVCGIPLFAIQQRPTGEVNISSGE